MITAQFPHTFLLCFGVSGCINGTIVSISLAKDIPRAENVIAQNCSKAVQYIPMNDRRKRPVKLRGFLPA